MREPLRLYSLLLRASLGILAATVPIASWAQFGGVEHVKLKVRAPQVIAPGKAFDLVVRLEIDPGFHIQSNKPAPNYVPTVVKVSGPSGFGFGEPRYPPSERVRAAGETIPVFSGTPEVFVPVTVPRKAAGKVTLKVVCSYQACDEGSCYPPTETTAEVSVTVGAPAPRTEQHGAKPAPSTSGTAPSKPTHSVATPEPKKAPSVPLPSAPVKPVETAVGSGAKKEAPPVAGYSMAKIAQFVGPEEFARFLEGGSSEAGESAGRVSRLLQSGNLLVALPLIFLLGLALNLTPCVYPIIPITISYFGSQTGKDGKKPLTLAVVYVLGMAFMYSALGVAAGMTGTLFGSQLQNPWVLFAFALVMFALALSQFDRPDGRPIWEFQLPGFLRNRAQSRSGIVGALLMGMMVGVVAAPCIGPAVIALLQWVGMQQSPMLGFAVFLSLSLGLGLPYLFLATASGSVRNLPRAGEWMMGVKHIFGAVLIWMGFYYLQTPLALVYAGLPKIAMVGVTVLLALYLLFLDRSGAGIRGFATFRRLVGISAVALAVWLAMPAPAERIAWKPYSDTALEKAIAEREPVLIDFTAAWCAACKELEEKTFTDPRVGEISRRYVALRADMTNYRGPEAQKWQKIYGISGLPTIVRLTPL